MIRILLFFSQNAAFTKKMGPKKSRRVRNIDVPTDTLQEFELGDRWWQINSKGGRQVKVRKRHRNRGRKPGGRKLHTEQRRESQKSLQGQTKVTQKSIQRLQERWAHLNRTQDTRRGI